MMWNKYDYVCSDCDALIEITTQENIRDWRGWCACGSPSLTMISIVPATIGDIA
jgi:DNA-directed RNA polymerase subunit RPC12/RpoP